MDLYAGFNAAEFNFLYSWSDLDFEQSPAEPYIVSVVRPASRSGGAGEQCLCILALVLIVFVLGLFATSAGVGCVGLFAASAGAWCLGLRVASAVVCLAQMNFLESFRPVPVKVLQHGSLAEVVWVIFETILRVLRGQGRKFLTEL